MMEAAKALGVLLVLAIGVIVVACIPIYIAWFTFGDLNPFNWPVWGRGIYALIQAGWLGVVINFCIVVVSDD